MNPAHYTFNEYLGVINPKEISHPAGAYSNYRAMDFSHEKKTQEYSNLVRQFLRFGIHFEIREKQIDRWALQYSKQDDAGNIVRDEKGLAVALTMEEKQEQIQPRFRYEHGLFDVTNGRLIAETQDEWGCLLIMSDPNYRKFGLGHELLAEQFRMYPSRDSGGMTPDGYRCSFKAHQKLVREYLVSGGYRRDYLSGVLTGAQIRRVLKQSDITHNLREESRAILRQKGYSESDISTLVLDPKRYKKELDLNFSNSKNWLLHSDGNWAVLYDKKLLEIVNTPLQDDFAEFVEKAIKGYVYVGGVYDNLATPKLFRLYGENEKIKAFMAEVALNLDVGQDVRVFRKDLGLLKKMLGDKVVFSEIKNSTMTNAKVVSPTIQFLKEMNFREKAIRKSCDPFDEKWVCIQEMASALADPKLEKESELGLSA